MWDAAWKVPQRICVVCTSMVIMVLECAALSVGSHVAEWLSGALSSQRRGSNTLPVGVSRRKLWLMFIYCVLLVQGTAISSVCSLSQNPKWDKINLCQNSWRGGAVLSSPYSDGTCSWAAPTGPMACNCCSISIFGCENFTPWSLAPKFRPTLPESVLESHNEN